MNIRESAGILSIISDIVDSYGKGARALFANPANGSNRLPIPALTIQKSISNSNAQK